MLDLNTRKKILKAVRDCRISTDEDFLRVLGAFGGIAITDFEPSRESRRESSRRIVKTAEVADILGMSMSSVRSLVKSGELIGYRKPGNKGWAGIIRSSVDEYVERVSGKDSRR